MPLGCRALLKEGDNPLLGRLGRTILAHVYRQHRMGRSVGWGGVRIFQFDRLELVSKLQLIGLETRVWNSAVALEAEPDHRQVLVLEPPSCAGDLFRRRVEGPKTAFFDIAAAGNDG